MFVTQFARIDWVKGDVAVGKLQLSLFPQNIFVLAGVTVSLEQKHLREKVYLSLKNLCLLKRKLYEISPATEIMKLGEEICVSCSK